jgi:hypothetical protein
MWTITWTLQNQITIDNENVVVLQCKSNFEQNEFVGTRK